MDNKKNKNKKIKQKKVIVDKKLDELAKQERENYGSRSWNICTCGGFYN